MKRGFGCGRRVVRAGAALTAVAGLVPLACHAYDEAAYEAETSEADDASVDATLVSDALAESATTGQPDATADAMADADTTEAEASCAPAQEANPCSVIPSLHGTQTVDGLNTEFCGVPSLVFNVASGHIPSGTAVFPTPAPVLTLQVAWTETALAVFAHVKESPVTPETDGGGIYLGDAIELFVAASSASLVGTPAGDPGTFHFILTPPSPSGRAAIGQSYATNAGANYTPLQPSTFTSLLVADGYDLEVTFPWALFGGDPPTSGSFIGFDFGLDVSLTDEAEAGPKPTQALQAFYYVNPATLAAPTACNEPEPYCDDRTWCTPQLE